MSFFFHLVNSAAVIIMNLVKNYSQIQNSRIKDIKMTAECYDYKRDFFLYAPDDINAT